jgi:hypothetical protein
MTAQREPLITATVYWGPGEIDALGGKVELLAGRIQYGKSPYVFCAGSRSEAACHGIRVYSAVDAIRDDEQACAEVARRLADEYVDRRKPS